MAAAKRFMVEELRREREASSLNISELTTFVDGGEMLRELTSLSRRSSSTMNRFAAAIL